MGNQSVSAGTPWTPWVAPDRYDAGYLGVIVADQVNSFEQFSRLESRKGGEAFTCTSTAGDCGNADSYIYNVILGPCTSKVTDYCIDALASTNSNGKNFATFNSIIYPDHRNSFSGDSNYGLPDPSEPSIWSIPNAPHPHGDLYAVVSGLSGGFSRGGRFSNPSFYARLIPVYEVNANASTSADQNGAYSYPSCWQRQQDGRNVVGCSGLNPQGVGPQHTPCVLMIGLVPNCYVEDVFPADTSFSLTLKLGTTINGWLHGRVSAPDVTIATDSAGGETINVTATPVVVPIFAAGDSYSNLPSDLQNAYSSQISLALAGGGFSRQYGPAYNPDPLLRNFTLAPPPYGDASIQVLTNWMQYAGNKSVSENPAWEIHSLSNTNTSSSNPCFTTNKGLVGLVSTNSTTYSDGPPAFQDGSLNYKVESAHFTSTGNEFLGTYDLNLQSEVARCLYNFGTSPLRASISIVDANGQNQVATTSFNEANGWINFSAKGFTFSAPTLKLRLIQDVSLAPTPEPSTVKPVAKKITITCVKGKSLRKVTSIKPKCPSGFKKR